MITYGIIGAGWRSEFYLRIAALLPNTFAVSGIYIRNREKRREFAEKYAVPIVDTLDALLGTGADFIVSCVSYIVSWPPLPALIPKGGAVLSDTPIAITDELMATYNTDWRVQVAEQFHLQPYHAAVKAVIDSGILGEVHQVQLSCCHDYHAASLLRFFLDTGEELPRVNTVRLNDRITRYNSRRGYIEPTLTDATQVIKIFQFAHKSAVYDFTVEQYFSDIRAPRITVRGTMGEIADGKCTYLQNGIPHTFPLTRNALGTNGNLNGFSLVNITGNGQVWYDNPFKNARLSDEEIAIATCLSKMDDYVRNRTEFYSVQSAKLDADFFCAIAD